MFIEYKSFHPKAIEFESQMIKNQKQNWKKTENLIRQKARPTLRIFNNNTNNLAMHIFFIIYILYNIIYQVIISFL